MKRLLFLLTLFVALGMQAQRHVMTVNVSKPTARINPAMYGVFFEDINFGADGGLYAELVKNRSFEFPAAGGVDTFRRGDGTGRAALLRPQSALCAHYQ